MRKQNSLLVFKRQTGLSLIELMIAMFIGLFLLAGITSSYVYSKKSSIYRDQNSLLEDNGRIALEVMSKTLQHTGYTSKSGALLDNKFIKSKPTSRSCSGGAASVINTTLFPSDSTEDGANGDSIGVVYLGDADVSTDCSGGVLPNTCHVGAPGAPDTDAAKIYSRFYIDSSDKTLVCAGSRDNVAHPISDGVEDMQILYGVNIDGSSDRTVERYVNASNMNGLWNNVTSIQIALLLRSEKEVLDKAQIKKFTLLDKEVTTLSDRYQRAVFSTTVSLRN